MILFTHMLTLSSHDISHLHTPINGLYLSIIFSLFFSPLTKLMKQTLMDNLQVHTDYSHSHTKLNNIISSSKLHCNFILFVYISLSQPTMLRSRSHFPGIHSLNTSDEHNQFLQLCLHLISLSCLAYRLTLCGYGLSKYNDKSFVLKAIVFVPCSELLVATTSKLPPSNYSLTNSS